MRRLLYPLIATGLLSATPGWAETHALVVGIDAYPNMRGAALAGAVSDAKDIDGALRRRGVSDITLLLDAAATRASVLGALDGMIERVRRDDLVIVSFAGHGAAEPRRPLPGQAVEQDNVRSVFLLSGVALPGSSGRLAPSQRAAAGERIAGTEMNLRLRKLEERGARTIFVADTCFGGGLTRSWPFTTTAPPITYRTQPVYIFADGEDPLEAPWAGLPAAIDTDRDAPALTLLGAVDSGHKAPEVRIPRDSNTMRGALSFAFARVLDGDIKPQSPGVITRGELMRTVRTTVRSYADNLQDPDLKPRGDATVTGRVVIDMARDFPGAAPAVVAVAEAPNGRRPVRIFGADAISTSADGTRRRFEIAPVPSADAADLIYDPAKRTITSPTGDRLADDVAPADINAIAEREAAMRRLLPLARTRPHELRLGGGDDVYRTGDGVVVDARPTDGAAATREYYVLLDVAGSGRIELLYPRMPADPRTLPQDQPLQKMQVTPPYGTDTLILVTSPAPLDRFIAAVAALQGTTRTLDLIDAIEAEAAGDIRIGIQNLFTANRSAGSKP